VVWIQLNHKLWENPKSVIQWDVINYYQFLPAVFDYGDLSLKFIDKNPDLLKWQFWPHTSPTGMYTNKMSMGHEVLIRLVASFATRESEVDQFVSIARVA
jgi:hypothetical protein